MRKKVVSAIAGLLLPVLLVAPVVTYAQSDNQEVAKEAIAERIEKRKAELNVRLERAQETRLKARCKAAQTLLTKAKARSEEVESRRITAYKELQDRLTSLVEKVRSNGGNATDLEAAQTTLNVQIESLQQAFDSYQLALDDAAAIDCVADPVGFKATLETARQLHDSIGKTFTDLRTTIQTVLKPAVTAIKVAS